MSDRPREEARMLAALHDRVAAQHPRPATLTNEGCCYSDERLAAILAKSDDDLGWADYQTLLTLSRCTGTYEELVHFVPHAMRYCQRVPEDAGDCLSSLIYFLSHEFDRLTGDGLAQPVTDALRELFAVWTATFHVTHYDLAACHAKGWRLEHSDIVDGSDLVRSFLDDLLRFQTFAGLAEELVGSLAALPAAAPSKSAWYLEYAHECRVGYARWVQTRDEIRSEMAAMLAGFGDRTPHDDTPPWSRSGWVVRLINDTELLRRHLQGIEVSVVAQEPSPTYWAAVRRLLDYPAPDQPSGPPDVPPFIVEHAKAYRPEPTQREGSSADAPRGPIWPKLKAQRERMLAAVGALAPGMAVDETLAVVQAVLAGMGTQFRGRVPGFEDEMSFRLLVVSGNYALCENESGALRIPFKDFAAAVEAGKLVEVPEEADPARS